MKYKFSTKVFGQEGIYGIEYDSLPNNEKALFEINSHIWTSEEIQDLLNRISSLTGDKYIQYQVEDGHLGIMIDKEGTAFFNLMNRTQEKEDFEWPTEKFVQFLKEFKDFLQKNGR